MNSIYSLQPVFFKRLISIVMILGLPVLVLSALWMGQRTYSLLYAISSVLLAIIIFVIFYVVRYEASTIAINGEDVSVEFFNKGLFKQAPIKSKRNLLKVVKCNSTLIELQYQSQRFIVRRNSVSDNEWKELHSYFC